MEKKYPQPEDNSEENIAREPEVEYGMEIEEDLYPQPPLTEEELKNALTGDQVIKLWQDYIEKIFNK